VGVLERVGKADIAPVSAEKKLCLNFRWKKNCSICADACPASAIDLETLRIDGSRCVGCGLCCVVCPAGALALEARPRSGMIGEIDGVLEKGEAVIFSCDRSGGAFGKAGKVKGSIVVPCLSFIDEGLVLECYRRGARDVKLEGCSPQCKFKKGRRIYKRTLALVEELRNALNIQPGTPRARRKRLKRANGQDSEGKDRRDFIRMSGLELVRAAYGQGTKGKGRDGWRWVHRLPAARTDLLRAAEKSVACSHRIARTDGMRFADIRADRALCSMCGACGALCPTGAIGTVELDRRSVLYFNFGWCTGCLLCVRACPEHALGVDEYVDLGKISAPGRPLLSFATERCPKCKDRYIPERTKGECPVCRKRAADSFEGDTNDRENSVGKHQNV